MKPLGELAESGVFSTFTFSLLQFPWDSGVAVTATIHITAATCKQEAMIYIHIDLFPEMRIHSPLSREIKQELQAQDTGSD